VAVAVRLPERRSLPSTLSLEQVAAPIDCQARLRDRFLFALLACTGMRIGQALGLRHEDVVAWEQRIQIRAREGAPRRARSKGGAEGGVPVPGGRSAFGSRRISYGTRTRRWRIATLAYRDGVQLEVIGALLTHRSPSSALIYTHPTAEARKNNDVRLIEVFERDEHRLSRILEGLDAIEADHASSEELDLRALAAPDQTEGG
jgi:integrase